MGTRWGTVVVDSLDPNRLARWWAEVLEYKVLRQAAGEVTIGLDEGPRLVFIRVPDAKAEKNRLHLELHPDDQDAEVERLIDMGARRADVGQPQDAGWVVLKAGSDSRQRIATITPAGTRTVAAARDAWRAAQSELETALGADAVHDLHLQVDTALIRLNPLLERQDDGIDD